MNSTLFNPAVFAYTLYVKFANPRYWIIPLLLMTVPSFGLILELSFPHPHLTVEIQKRFAEGVHYYFLNPTAYLVLAYLFISDGPAGGKLVAEADSLSLLFTRPITRFCYVFTRYFAAVIGISILLVCALFLCYLVGLCYGVSYIDVSLLTVASIILNAASWCSLVIFIHSAPPLIAIMTVFILMGCACVGNVYSQAQQSTNAFLELLKAVCLFIEEWFGDFLPSSIDLLAMSSASAFDTYALAIFVSNIAFFLLIAAFALSCREFSYGSD
jgi:hypothetical protein